MVKRIFALCFLVTTSVCLTYAQNDYLILAEGVEAHKGIDRIYKDFSETYRTLDSKKLSELYTEDVAYLSPSRDVVFGRQQVYENFTGFFNRVKESNRTMEIRFRILKRSVTGDMGYDVGVFDLKYSRDGEIVTEAKGKFVVVNVKGSDGLWRFAVDGYSDLK